MSVCLREKERMNGVISGGFVMAPVAERDKFNLCGRPGHGVPLTLLAPLSPRGD